MEIDDLNEQLNLSIPKVHFKTIGGFVLHEIKRIPRPGESFQFDNFGIKISQANKRSVIEVLIDLNLMDESNENEGDKSDE
jgi:CBS domain containing-hemolysin-like protein